MNHSLPSVSSDIPRDLRAWVERVRETLEQVKVGQDSLTTIINNYGSGEGGGGGGGGAPDPYNLPCGRTVSPTAPTGLTLTAGFSGFLLSWDAATYCGHSHTEVWGLTEDAVGQAVLLGSSSGRMYSHLVDSPGARWCFWVRHVNLLGEISPYNALAGVCGATALDPEYLLDALKGLITEGQLYQALQERLDLIEITATDITEERDIRESADGALAMETKQVGAVANGAAAGVTDITTARVGYCRWNPNLSSGSTNYAKRGQTTEHKDKTECLDPAAGGGEREWLVGLPWATAVKQVSATTAGICTIKGVSSTVVVDGKTVINPLHDTQLKCEAAKGVWTDGRSAILEQRFQTLENADGTLSAQYTVKTDVGGLVSGYGLASSESLAGPTTSEFGINADRFFVSGPTATAKPAAPYTGQAWRNTTDNTLLLNTTYYWDGSQWTTSSAAASIPFVVQTSPTTTYAPPSFECVASFMSSVTTGGVWLSTDDGVTRLHCGALSAPVTPDKIANSINLNRGAIASAYVSGNGSLVTISAKSARSLRVYSSPTQYNGETSNTVVREVPAGVYISTAYIHRATISWAQINQATIDWLTVTRQLWAENILSGSISVDKCIQSTSYTPTSGWRICGNGAAEFSNITIRAPDGTVLLSSGTGFQVGIGGNLLSNSGMSGGITPYAVTYQSLVTFGYTLGVNPTWSGWRPPNTDVLGYTYTAAGTVATAFITNQDKVTVSPGETYELSGYAVVTNCTVALRVTWYTAAGVAILGADNNPSIYVVGIPAAPESSVFANWARAGGFVVAPATAYSATAQIQVVTSATTATRRATITRLHFGPAVAGRTTLTDWYPRGPGQITPGNASTYIADASIDSAFIKNLTADKLVSGNIKATERLSLGSDSPPVDNAGYADAFYLDGGARALFVRNTTNDGVYRSVVRLGYISTVSGTARYGLRLRDRDGFIAVSSTGTEDLAGTKDADGDFYPGTDDFFISSAYIKRLKTGNLNPLTATTMNYGTDLTLRTAAVGATAAGGASTSVTMAASGNTGVLVTASAEIGPVGAYGVAGQVKILKNGVAVRATSYWLSGATELTVIWFDASPGTTTSYSVQVNCTAARNSSGAPVAGTANIFTTTIVATGCKR